MIKLLSQNLFFIGHCEKTVVGNWRTIKKLIQSILVF